MPTITYHDRLRRARLDADMTLEQLAERAGLSTSTISAVERGLRDLTAPRLFAWARACKVSLEWIAGEPVRSPAPVDETALQLELEVIA